MTRVEAFAHRRWRQDTCPETEWDVVHPIPGDSTFWVVPHFVADPTHIELEEVS